ncbi:MAG TPA: SAF domain-containing protein [bacterium]|nr:SAF domain-containing protein [bacterium]
MRLFDRLSRLDRERHPIRVAVIGAGQMGSGLVHQLARLPGMRVAGICDLVGERAVAAAGHAGLSAGVAGARTDAERLLAEERTCVVSQADWLVDAPSVDAVLDATGDPETGARLAFASITRRKPFITMNVEADVTVGPILAWLARRSHTVYTVAGGDEPSVLCEMVDFARAIGLDVVCAGKGKNNRLDRTATAEAVRTEADARGMSPRMLAAFVDGTKTMAEMASLANATGLAPDLPGMHGPQANLADLLRTFVPEADGGILRRTGVVEYAIGDVAPGVFLIVTSASGPIRRDLAYLKMGEGPYYLLYRPYHLASLEAPLSVARAMLSGETTMAAAGAARAECVAVAKRDLQPGESLDGIGGQTVYGLAEPAARATAARAVPIGVAQGARVLRHITAGSVLTDGDVALDETLTIVQLRRLQETLTCQGHLDADVTGP